MEYIVGCKCNFDGQDYELIQSEALNKKASKKIMLKLNLLSILILIGSYWIFSILNMFIHGMKTESYSIRFTLPIFILFIAGSLLIIIIHEYLHGIGFRIDQEVNKNDVKFGFSKKLLAPYCVCKKPIRIPSARISLMLPVYVMCMPLLIIGLVINSHFLLLVSSFCLTGSTGDLYYFWKLRKISKDYYMYEATVYDQNLFGFYIFRKSDESN